MTSELSCSRIAGTACFVLGLLLTSALPLSAQTLPPEASDEKLRADCRLAAQSIVTGRPEPLFDRAMQFITRCEVSAGDALGAAWRHPSADSTALEELYFASARVRDQRILNAIMAVAADPTRPWLPRATAIRVMAAYVQPAMALIPDEIRPRADSIVRYGMADHWVQREGSDLLLPGSHARIQQLLLRLASEDPDPALRHTAGFVERRLRRYFAP